MVTGTELVKNNLAVDESVSLQEAMTAITNNQRGAVAVVDKDFFLQGVVADGDIRRAMLRGATMVTPVYKVMNLNPVSFTREEIKNGRGGEVLQRESSINILPIVDEHNKLVEVVVRNPGQRKEF